MMMMQMLDNAMYGLYHPDDGLQSCCWRTCFRNRPMSHLQVPLICHCFHSAWMMMWMAVAGIANIYVFLWVEWEMIGDTLRDGVHVVATNRQQRVAWQRIVIWYRFQ